MQHAPIDKLRIVEDLIRGDIITPKKAAEILMFDVEEYKAEFIEKGLVAMKTAFETPDPNPAILPLSYDNYTIPIKEVSLDEVMKMYDKQVLNPRDVRGYTEAVHSVSDIKPDDTKYSGTAYEAFMVSTSKLQKKFAARKKNKVARQARKLNRK